MSRDRGRRRGVDPRCRRRLRLIAEATLLIVGVCLLAWGLDTLARVGAESLLERDLQKVAGVAERPEVQLAQGPLIPQVIRGAYRGAEADLRQVQSGPLKIERIQARISDVRLPLKDLLLRDIRQVGIGHSVAVVTLRFNDLNAYFDATGRPLRLARTADGAVRLSGSFDVLGQDVPVTATVDLSVDGSRLRITPHQIDTGDATLSRVGRILLDQRIALTVPLDGLPFGSQLTDLEITTDGLRITTESRAIVLRP